MTSQDQTSPKASEPQHTLPIGRRLLWILLVVSIQLMYLPTSEWMTGGIEPKLPIDVFPIWPVWVVPYVLCYPLWFAGFAWATLKMSDRMFRAFVVAFIVTCSLSVAIFIFYPTYVRAAELYGSDPFTTLLRLIHESAGRYSALPSGHIYITALLAFFYSLWYPRYRPLWALILVIVSFSTLFTAQHYILDILAGLLVAMLGLYAGLKWVGVKSMRSLPAIHGVLLSPSSKRVAD